MARYRKIDPRIWNDESFRALSDRGKLTFLFLLTHPHLTALGAMRASVPGLAAELSWPEKAFREAFREALTKGMLSYDETACFLMVTNFLRYNRPESPNVVRAWGDSLDLLPECELKAKLIQRVKAFLEGLHKGFGEALPEAFREGSSKPSPYQEQEQEQDQKEELLSGGEDPPDEASVRKFFDEALHYLNARAGTSFRANSRKHFEHFRARLREGASPDDFQTVTDRKVADWKDDPRMVKYLRPETLWLPKFWDYLGQASGAGAEQKPGASGSTGARPVPPTEQEIAFALEPYAHDLPGFPREIQTALTRLGLTPGQAQDVYQAGVLAEDSPAVFCDRARQAFEGGAS